MRIREIGDRGIFGYCDPECYEGVAGLKSRDRLETGSCEVVKRERNGLTFHLSLSTGFRHAPVRLHRTMSAAFGQLHSRCGQLISEMTACVVHDKILNCAKCVIKLL